jgi:hypothetical protein
MNALPAEFRHVRIEGMQQVGRFQRILRSRLQPDN